MRRLFPILLVVLAAACSPGGSDAASAPGSEPTSTLEVPATTSTSLGPVPTVPALPPLPAAPTDGEVRALLTGTGVVVPVFGPAGSGWRVGTPCGKETVVSGGTPLYGATVVLDPGHGGIETGATGENGLVEKDLNLRVSELARAALEREGATVVLTRTADYRITLQARAAIVKRLQPPVFISVHFNGGHDGPSDRPGTEMYYQHASPESKRLAGLLYEETYSVFDGRSGVQWHANVDAGAKYRLNSKGGDYYGILRHTAGITSVLSEGLFLSAHVSEAELLAQPDVQEALGEAIAQAVRRFMLGNDAGSGFVEPIPRETPAGPGGGGTGCVDPVLE